MIYFHEYLTANCILNTHSAITKPSHFTAEFELKVDYIEMKNCSSELIYNFYFNILYILFYLKYEIMDKSRIKLSFIVHSSDFDEIFAVIG